MAVSSKFLKLVYCGMQLNMCTGCSYMIASKAKITFVQLHMQKKLDLACWEVLAASLNSDF